MECDCNTPNFHRIGICGPGSINEALFLVSINWPAEDVDLRGLHLRTHSLDSSLDNIRGTQVFLTGGVGGLPQLNVPIQTKSTSYYIGRTNITYNIIG